MVAKHAFALTIADPSDVDGAVAAMRTSYRHIKFDTPDADERAEKIGQLAKSSLTQAVDRKSPWDSADLLMAAVETLPDEPNRSRAAAAVQTRPASDALSAVYPKMGQWYESEMERIVTGGKDPDRETWQTARQGLIAATKDMIAPNTPDGDAKTAIEVAVAQTVAASLDRDDFKRIEAKAPWSGMDVRLAHANLVPASQRNTFITQHVFGANAFKTIQDDCPVLADNYRARAAALGYVAAPAAAPAPAVGGATPA